MIAYVIRQLWTVEVLLLDGTWGNYEQYEDRIEVFTCQVSANRRAVKVGGLVLPWETLEIEFTVAPEDSPELPTPLESSAQPSLSVPRSHGLF